MTDDERAELDRAIPVGIYGLTGYKGGFSTLMDSVPRVGEYINWHRPRRPGRGRYAVKRVEWTWDHLYVGRAEVFVERVDG